MTQRQPTWTPLPPHLSAMPPVLVLAVTIVLAILPPASRPLAGDQAIPQNVAPIVSEIIKNGNYQSDVPGAKADGAEAEPSRPPLSSTQTPNSPQVPEPSSPIVGGAVGNSIIQTIAYALVAILAVLALAAIFKAYRGSARRTDPEVAETISAPIILPPPPSPVLDRVEELVAAGDFEAAIHLMLLRALAALRTRVGNLPDSLTSREILRHSDLPREAVKPLSVIIGAVEVSHFGGQAPNAAVCRLCAENYRQFLGTAR